MSQSHSWHGLLASSQLPAWLCSVDTYYSMVLGALFQPLCIHLFPGFQVFFSSLFLGLCIISHTSDLYLSVCLRTG